MTHYKHIIVPVDGSEGAARAAVFANELAITTGTPVTHLHVIIEKARKESAHRAFAAARTAIGNSTHLLDERIVFGEAAEEILAFAEAHGPALIVMGRRGLGRVTSLLLGSVSDAVVHRAKGPVTIVS